MLPAAKSVVCGQAFLRLEYAPDWVDIALERLPPDEKANELTLEELGWLASVLRQSGCASPYLHIDESLTPSC